MTDNSTLLIVLRPLSGARDDNKTHVHRESEEFLLESPTTPLVCHVFGKAEELLSESLEMLLDSCFIRRRGLAKFYKIIGFIAWLVCEV